MDFFTLRALTAEWDAVLRGARLADAWTQNPGELSLAFDGGAGASTVRVHCEGALPLLFRTGGHGRARRNTAAVFEEAHGRTVAGVRTAERDRFVFFDFEDRTALQLRLFGPQPNAFLVDGAERVAEAFLSDAEWRGEPAPAPSPAPAVETFEAFAARWRTNRKTLGQAVASAVPLLDRALAAEATRRADLDPDAPPDAEDTEQRRLFDAARGLIAELDEPRPHLYWRGGVAEALSLVPVTEPPETWRGEAFETVDGAVSVWARRRLAQRAFTARYRPLEARLRKEATRLTRSAERMLEELSRPSRAERYERFGHLLMAQATGEPAGRDGILLPDLLGDGEPVSVPLDASLTGVENAERFYNKARRTRAARAHAESRWEAAQADAERAASLLARLEAVERLPELEALLCEEADALQRILGGAAGGEEALPYHRFEVRGWEVRVGKNARSNRALTTRHAGPHDLWLHARGVPGSHVVIRRPSRTVAVPAPVVEAAARLAAHFSKAKTQPLAPVTVTERKYVRPVKGGPPGLVRVDREEVVMVEPAAPAALGVG